MVLKQNMKILDIFKRKERVVERTVVKEVEKKQQDPTNLISPVYKEVYPKMNLDKILAEGVFSWSFMGLSAISDEVMVTPLRLYNKTGEEVFVHPVLDLLSSPNDLQSQEEFFYQMTMVLLAVGEAPLYTNGKNPTNMVLLNPIKLDIIFQEGETKGYTYQQTNGATVSIEEPEDLIFIKLPCVKQLTQLRGEGVLSYIMPTLDLDRFIEEYLNNFFYNDATPGAVLETDKTLTEAIINRMKKQINTLFRGVKNKHKLFIAEHGLKWREISSKISS